jgi:hypothetical protein
VWFLALPPGGRGYPPPPTAVLGLALVAAGITILLLNSPTVDRADPVDTALGARTTAGEVPAPYRVESANVATNHRGGYRFEYPASWSAARFGHNTKIVNPARDAVIAVGPSARRAETTGDRFAASVRRSYDHVRIETRRRQVIEGRRVTVIAGNATNASGVAIRWLALTVPTRKGVIEVAAFVHVRSDPRVVLPALHMVAESIVPAGGRRAR